MDNEYLNYLNANEGTNQINDEINRRLALVLSKQES